MAERLLLYLQVNTRERIIGIVVLETNLVVEIEKDLWKHLLSLEGEAIGSVSFIVLGFHSTGMSYPELLFLGPKWSKRKAE